MSQAIVLQLAPDGGMLRGEEAGRAARAALNLDAVDRGPDKAVVRIGSPVVTASFLRGLLEPSVRSLGLDGFTEKYAFEASPVGRESIRLNARSFSLRSDAA